MVILYSPNLVKFGCLKKKGIIISYYLIVCLIYDDIVNVKTFKR